MKTLKYRKLHGYKYLLEALKSVDLNTPVVAQHKYFTIAMNFVVIHKGYAWDGLSGPTFDTDNSMLASLVHDIFYQAMREGLLPPSFRKTADQEFHRILIEQGMSKFRAWYMYSAVRIFSAGLAKPQKDPRLRVYDLKIKNNSH